MTTITLPRAVAEQALEALESVYGDSCDALHALRAALAQEQAEPDHETRAELAEQQVVQLAEERDHYRRLLEKAQQAEPVACPIGLDKKGASQFCSAGYCDACKQQEAEPVAWRITDGEGDWEYRTDLPEDWSIQWSARHGRKYEPLYTAPPKAEPLTEEEIDRIRADEREACAKVCEETDLVDYEHCMVLHTDGHATLRNAAAAIRARSKSC